MFAAISVGLYNEVIGASFANERRSCQERIRDAADGRSAGTEWILNVRVLAKYYIRFLFAAN